jgi:hypothetical protein
VNADKERMRRELLNQLELEWKAAESKGYISEVWKWSALIEARLKLSAASERVREWIPVSERLPESRTWVIGCVEHDGQRHVAPVFGVVITNDDNRFRWESEFPVTHWQPLPDPPALAPPGNAPGQGKAGGK